jgi:isovaleryl-CoA dehydrogenase
MRIDTDGVKLITSKLAKNISDSSIQVLGGNGYIGEYHVERFWRDSKLLEIGGGTNEILQKNITKDIIKLNKNF